MLPFITWVAFFLVGLILGRSWAFLVPVALLAIFLVNAAISNQLGDAPFTAAITDLSTLGALVGLLVVAEAGTLVGWYVRRRFAFRLAKSSYTSAASKPGEGPPPRERRDARSR
jgi:hypothetical protein